MKKLLLLLLVSSAANAFRESKEYPTHHHTLKIINNTNLPMSLHRQDKSPITISPNSRKILVLRNDEKQQPHYMKLRAQGKKPVTISPHAKVVTLKWVWDKYTAHLSCETQK